eukprot:TRINITY_DN603_c0_g7_i1.p1 TRINITY_DN603_c0_g7~~TRINITY_DN603_c0_g7_i1.p1  ORF type:complete len:375 (+),score=112.27 TRINITY_DN603_c0_g7_i1:287-1411(+)
MSKFHCHCLNVWANLVHMKVVEGRPDLLTGNLGLGGVQCHYEALYEEVEDGDLLIHRCLSCNTDVCWKSGDQFMAPKDLAKTPEQVENIMKSPDFSPVFKIVLPKKGKPLVDINGFQDSSVMRWLQDVMEAGLKNEVSQMQERIEAFRQKELELFKEFERNAQVHRTLLFETFYRLRDRPHLKWSLLPEDVPLPTEKEKEPSSQRKEEMTEKRKPIPKSMGDMVTETAPPREKATKEKQKGDALKHSIFRQGGAVAKPKGHAQHDRDDEEDQDGVFPMDMMEEGETRRGDQSCEEGPEEREVEEEEDEEDEHVGDGNAEENVDVSRHGGVDMTRSGREPSSPIIAYHSTSVPISIPKSFLQRESGSRVVDRKLL